MGVSGRDAYKSICSKANLMHMLGEEKVPRCSTEGEHGPNGGRWEKGDARKASGEEVALNQM